MKTTEQQVNGVGPKTRAEKGTREKTCRKVRIKGLTPIMFDRYPGDNDTKLEVWQKLYFIPDSRTLCFPSENIMSFLSAQNTDSAPKKLLDSRKYKKFAQACSSYVEINPEFIPFTRDEKPIQFGKFQGDKDLESGVEIRRHTARLEKGIPNPKIRPMLPLPWELEFTLTLYPNSEIQEQQLMNVFSQGGIALGLGTFRPRYGKFEVVYWE
jgi:hypothetical protein